MSSAQRLLATLVLMSTVAVLLRGVSRRAPLPYPVLLAVLGVAVGAIPGTPLRSIGADAILLAFVPGLIFQAALTLHLPALRRVLLPVLSLATLGVALTVAGIGLLAHYALHLDWPQAVLLAAVLAPTDPIAVVAVLRRSHAPGTLVALLEGESLFNDGTGIAVFAAVVAAVDTGHATAGTALGRLAVIVAAGTGIGLAAGLIGAALLSLFREAQTEILLSLAVAYGSYLAADLAHTSGVVAVVVTGMVISGVSRRFPGLHTRDLDDFWSVLAFVLNALLFLLIGSALPLRDVLHESGGVLATFGIALGARLVAVHAILAVLDPRARRFPLRWRTVIVWGGMRGALSVALALVLAERGGAAHHVALLAYGAVLLSILLQGGTVRLLARGAPEVILPVSSFTT